MLPVVVFVLGGAAVLGWVAFLIARENAGSRSDAAEATSGVAAVLTLLTIVVSLGWGVVSVRSANQRADCVRVGDRYGVETEFRQYTRANWACYVVMEDGTLLPYDEAPLGR